jgi:hypothetical protein
MTRKGAPIASAERATEQLKTNEPTGVQRSLEKIEGNRASIFAGPMPRSDDPKPKRGSAALRRTQYPVSFWKVLAVVAAPGAAGNLQPTLMVYGLIFDQSDVISDSASASRRRRRATSAPTRRR